MPSPARDRIRGRQARLRDPLRTRRMRGTTVATGSGRAGGRVPRRRPEPRRRDRWLARHRNVHFHFTPIHASWLNQVEVCSASSNEPPSGERATPRRTRCATRSSGSPPLTVRSPPRSSGSNGRSTRSASLVITLTCATRYQCGVPRRFLGRCLQAPSACPGHGKSPGPKPGAHSLSRCRSGSAPLNWHSPHSSNAP